MSNRKSKYRDMLPQFIELYEKGYNCHSIGRELGVDYRNVWRILKEVGITINRSKAIRTHAINEEAFDELTNDSSYWLGCMYGDGSLVGDEKTNLISLHGHVDDMDHGEQFKSFLSSEHPVKKCKNKNGYYFSFASSKMCKRLNELGIYQNKTHTMTYPDFLEDVHHSHFIRGLFDTDGCMYVGIPKRYKNYQGKFSITMTKAMLETVKSIIEEQVGISPTCFYKTKGKNNNTYTLSYEGKNRLKLIYDWLYEDAEPNSLMQRKRDKFDLVFNKK